MIGFLISVVAFLAVGSAILYAEPGETMSTLLGMALGAVMALTLARWLLLWSERSRR